MTELDERKAAILRAIVEHYVDSAQPVGSQTVTQTAGLGVSAATVRNEMSVLERDGFIAQPHTSAGRVPTDPGYRYYVDHLAGAGALPPAERRRIADFFTTATMAMDDLLHETSQLLARVTAHAAVVVGPQSESVHVRSVHLALLQPRVLLAVVVMSNGAVEKETVVLDADADAEDVGIASARLTAYLPAAGSAELPTMTYTGDARRSPPTCSRPPSRGARRPTSGCTTTSRSTSAARAGSPPSRKRSRARARRGSSSCWSSTSCSGRCCASCSVPASRCASAPRTSWPTFRECSLVLAPYLVEGEAIGTVGVLGPTRMDYRKAQAAVSTVSRQLGQQLSR